MIDRTDDVTALRALLPAPDVEPMSPAAAARIEDRTWARLTPVEPRPRRRLRVVTLAAVAAALVVVPAVLLPGAGDHGGVTVGAAPAAAQVLDDAASAALRDDVTAPRADQWVYVRSVYTLAHPEPGDHARTDRQIWLSQQPTMKDGSNRYLERGHRVPIWYSFDHGSVPADVFRPTYAWFETLPTEPAALNRRLRDEIRSAGFRGTIDDAEVFSTIGDLISENVVPPRVEAALYRVVRRLPGIVVTTGVTDAIGRRGLGITLTDTDPSDRYVDTWVFDPGTHAYLGSRSRIVRSGGSKRPATTGGDACAVLQRAVVDHRYETPGR